MHESFLLLSSQNTGIYSIVLRWNVWKFVPLGIPLYPDLLLHTPHYYQKKYLLICLLVFEKKWTRRVLQYRQLPSYHNSSTYEGSQTPHLVFTNVIRLSLEMRILHRYRYDILVSAEHSSTITIASNKMSSDSFRTCVTYSGLDCAFRTPSCRQVHFVHFFQKCVTEQMRNRLNTYT